MTTNEFPAKPKAFSLRAAEPKSISILLASSDPDLRALAQSSRKKAEAYFATWLEEHSTDMQDKETLVVKHASISATGDPHTHSHIIIATSPKEEKP